jgi:hypothetical protein
MAARHHLLQVGPRREPPDRPHQKRRHHRGLAVGCGRHGLG